MTLVGSLFGVPEQVGYASVFLLVAGETAGALVPGETALIVAAAIASRGDLSLALVLAAGAAGAIVGDNIGFAIGDRGLRRLLNAGRRWQTERQWLATTGERFFAAHGPKAVILTRWLPGLRLVGAWFAGASGMPWRRFAIWNVLSGIAWALSVGGGAYLLGRAAGWAFGLVGLILTIALLLTAGIAIGRRRLPRASHEHEAPSNVP